MTFSDALSWSWSSKSFRVVFGMLLRGVSTPLRNGVDQHLDVVEDGPGHLLRRFGDSRIDSGCAAARRSCSNLKVVDEGFGVESEAVSRLDVIGYDVERLCTKFQLNIPTIVSSRGV